VATVAEALHYAHTRGLVHRDIKPANILIDLSGKPFVADFGLALKDEDFGKGGGITGTPAYMSPEQARGEGHLVDGRTDIFSLGVVFYELLTDRRPFRGDSLPQIIEQVSQAEARPPRQIDDTIPKELERICLKAIAKRASDRYTTAKDTAENLRLFLQSTVGPVSPLASAVPVAQPGSTVESTPTPLRQSDSDQRPTKIVPKGLRSFDEHDADFFLELLPGPRDRDGLPDSIRFWKQKIEQLDPDLTFRLGLIYGPSGCGKSSLIKAGLLPRLGKHVLPVYVEATPEETETRLLKGLRKACPELPQGLGLVDSLAQLRRGRIFPPERKLLLVLDQFEQWLHARRGEQNTELVAALRHCDAEHVQALVLVRDDFWMAATRFMRDLEICLVEGANSAAVDLFDLLHSKRVLTAFGLAYRVLPDRASEFTPDQQAFVDHSVTGLAQDGKIISVRLALFAEMVKGKPWTPATLREVGGTEGIGVSFLEETFSASTAPPEHRFHQRAAQTVLKALLPESGTDIKGQMRSRRELLEASGYGNRPRTFDDLIRILDPELRLISPTDPEGFGDDLPTTNSGERYYQLTHDYLVHSLRDWLTSKQRQTRRGRAELRLDETAKSWGATPRRQNLPTLSEWLSILVLTKRDKWSPLERRMLHAATRKHRAGLLFALFVIALSCVLPVLGSQYIRATLLADEFQMGLNDLAVIDNMKSCRFWIDPILQSKLVAAKKDNDTRSILRYSAALLPTHLDMKDTLYFQSLPQKTATGYRGYESGRNSDLAMTMLQKHDPRFASRMWEIATDKRREMWHRYFAAAKLIEFDPSNAKWSEIVPDLIAAHDFAIDPFLSFSCFISSREIDGINSRFKEQFREALIRKIDRSSESSGPWQLLFEFFTKEEALDLTIDGYLSGHFSLDSFKQYVVWYGPISASHLRELLVKRPSLDSHGRKHG
jgi:eukaryotic-like serine/threonine-protein kinase